MGKSKKSLDENTKIYSEYFSDDLAAIEEEMTKSKEYSKIIDDEIKKFSSTNNGLGVNKGGQHYLIEHITNAVQLQTQRQGLRRDKFAIKKAILDYAAKFADEEANGDAPDIAKAIENLLNKEKQKKENENKHSSEDLDKEIDNALKDED